MKKQLWIVAKVTKDQYWKEKSTVDISIKKEVFQCLMAQIPRYKDIGKLSVFGNQILRLQWNKLVWNLLSDTKTGQ